MKPLAWTILAVLAIYAMTAIIVFWPSEAPDMSPQIQKLETEKAQAKERAQAAEHRAATIDAALTLARANLEAARRRVKLPPSPAPGQVDPYLPLWAQEELDNRALLIRSLDENLDLERKQNAELKIALDGYKSTLVTSERQVECLKIAHAAHVAAIKKERWKGRLEGFAVGFGLGYFGGKLQ